MKGTNGQSSQAPLGEQVPQVLIHLRSLKPSFPRGLRSKIPKALPSLPKVAPMNLPKIGHFISKCEWDEAPPLPTCRTLVLLSCYQKIFFFDTAKNIDEGIKFIDIIQ